MTTREELRALAERVMALTGADREVDAMIAVALGIGGNVIATPEGWCVGGPSGQPFLSPAYTASIDAAMTLVPEGWHTKLAMEDRRTEEEKAEAAWRESLRLNYQMFPDTDPEPEGINVEEIGVMAERGDSGLR